MSCRLTCHVCGVIPEAPVTFADDEGDVEVGQSHDQHTLVLFHHTRRLTDGWSCGREGRGRVRVRASVPYPRLLPPYLGTEKCAYGWLRLGLGYPLHH